jgi:predicted restriction endonuclease
MAFSFPLSPFDGKVLYKSTYIRSRPIHSQTTDKQRLDPRNGIPLLASLHALFDEGLISFGPSGRMIVSSKLSTAEREIFGTVEASLRKTPEAKTAKYLAWHRGRQFKK